MGTPWTTHIDNECVPFYGVFNDDAGFANRGTFVIDRSGVVRFAEMNQPGEARDQKVWTEALSALKS
jgi:peroxiredoxin (alkyl hydroperoxide reductase subunit C)